MRGLVNELIDMAMHLSKYPVRTKRGLLLKAAEEITRLQNILDSRPAINAGLPQSYIDWSRSIYVCEAIDRDTLS